MRTAQRGIAVLISFVAITTCVTGLAVAQTGPRLEQLQVDLWPEYDRPDMLVIYRGTLPADLALPATLTLRIPARVGEPHAVAYADDSGSLLQANYTTQAAEEWLAVTFETPAPGFQLEFYDSLVRAGEQRSYTFVWAGDYAVEQLSMSLLAPPGATGIQAEPAILSPVEQTSGASRLVGGLGRLAEGQETQVMVSYQGGVAGAGETTSRRVDEGRSDTLLIVGVAIAVLVLVINGAVWYTRRPGHPPAETSPARPRRSKRKRRPSGIKTVEGTSLPASHCTQCGHSLRADDRFCGRCGTPVKRRAKTRE